ncbi:hypothetical protein niasHT_009398 [Heterodera trifolii]|uniref:ATPase AAA-type core domain-containing protein n=1 Tax=Heterodera trifolii TaxID=157864 RepID=A0ABD2M1N2_9BILA
MDEFAQHAAVQATQNVADLNAAALPQEGKRNVQQLVAVSTRHCLFLLKDVTQLCRDFHTFLCEPTRFAALHTPVALLLFGERGVGKRHVARTIADEAEFKLIRMVALAEDTLLCRKTGKK